METAARAGVLVIGVCIGVVNKPLPSLTLTTIDGKPYNTSGLRGKVLLLNFFASW